MRGSADVVWRTGDICRRWRLCSGFLLLGNTVDIRPMAAAVTEQ